MVRKIRRFSNAIQEIIEILSFLLYTGIKVVFKVTLWYCNSTLWGKEK